MKPYELFNLIINTEYRTYGLDVDWQIYQNDKAIYLLFEESSTGMDCKSSAKFLPRPYGDHKPKMWIHRGFADAYESCNNDIMKNFINAVNNAGDKKIIISGWSFGGAMAILAAEDFFFRTGKKAHVVTFGAPKIAGGIRTRNYLRNCIASLEMYAHKCDIVTKVPPILFKLERISLGNFNFLGLFKPLIYHGIYGNPELY